MNKRTFLKSGLSLAGLGLVNPFHTIDTLADAPVFTLPKLNFGYADLEPGIDARTVELHYTKHHQGYVDKLNEELRQGKFQYSSLEDLLIRYAAANRTIRNQGGGHYNHSFMWASLGRPDNSRISPDLEIELVMAFESVEGFKAAFAKAALDRFGSGWAWLCKGTDGKLFISSTSNQDNPLMKIEGIQTGKPILGIDVWEHAYYLKYWNKRAEYISAYLKLVNWAVVEKRFNEK